MLDQMNNWFDLMITIFRSNTKTLVDINQFLYDQSVFLYDKSVILYDQSVFLYDQSKNNTSYWEFLGQLVLQQNC